MPFTFSIEKKSDYLLIKSKGTIETLEEHISLNKKEAELILKSNIRKVIVDESQTLYSSSYTGILNTAMLINEYMESIPDQIKLFKIASIVKKEFLKEAYFWETYSRNRGYNVRIFFTIEDAINYIK